MEGSEAGEVGDVGGITGGDFGIGGGFNPGADVASGYNSDFGGTDPGGFGMGINVAAQVGEGGEHSGLSPGAGGQAGGGIMGGLGFSLGDLEAGFNAANNNNGLDPATGATATYGGQVTGGVVGGVPAEGTAAQAISSGMAAVAAGILGGDNVGFPGVSGVAVADTGNQSESQSSNTAGKGDFEGIAGINTPGMQTAGVPGGFSSLSNEFEGLNSQPGSLTGLSVNVGGKGDFAGYAGQTSNVEGKGDFSGIAQSSNVAGKGDFAGVSPSGAPAGVNTGIAVSQGADTVAGTGTGPSAGAQSGMSAVAAPSTASTAQSASNTDTGDDETSGPPAAVSGGGRASIAQAAASGGGMALEFGLTPSHGFGSGLSLGEGGSTNSAAANGFAGFGGAGEGQVIAPLFDIAQAVRSNPGNSILSTVFDPWAWMLKQFSPLPQDHVPANPATAPNYGPSVPVGLNDANTNPPGSIPYGPSVPVGLGY